MPKRNLSETLFKPQLNLAETSTLVRRLPPHCPQSKEKHWYRLLDRLAWIWRGISLWDILEVQSRIVINDTSRSNHQLYDTVPGYRPGNWVYEWSQQAMRWQQRAGSTADNQQAAHYWHKAASQYSIAAYPYLKGDLLADQALALASLAWQQVATIAPEQIKLLDIPLSDGKTLSAMLHTPADSKPPWRCVILCGELDALQTDYYRFFTHYLAPCGLAMLSIDLPGVGASSRWSLTQDSSYLHQQLLAAVRHIPWIDHQRVAAFGFRFGANIATRLAYLCPSQLKAVACLSPMVHSVFSNQQSQLPAMTLDVLANRLGMNNISDSVLRSELARYSLKTQGLLGRHCPLPLLAAYWQNDPFSSPEDAKLITSSSASGKLLEIQLNPIYRNVDRALSEISHWLQQQLN